MRLQGLAAVLGVAASAAWGCGESLGTAAKAIEQPTMQLAFRTTPATVPVGRHFAIDFMLCPRGGAALPAEVRVDATMPEHRHGMNYRPSVTATGNGLYRAEGLLFHMPGRWELVFELRATQGVAPLRLTQSIQVE